MIPKWRLPCACNSFLCCLPSQYSPRHVAANAIPPLFFYSMQLGSQRNELQDNLYALADMYAGQVRLHQARLSALLLPLMIVLVGAVIALAVLAMFLPMTSLLNSMSVL